MLFRQIVAFRLKSVRAQECFCSFESAATLELDKRFGSRSACFPLSAFLSRISIFPIHTKSHEHLPFQARSSSRRRFCEKQSALYIRPFCKDLAIPAPNTAIAVDHEKIPLWHMCEVTSGMLRASHVLPLGCKSRARCDIYGQLLMAPENTPQEQQQGPDTERRGLRQGAQTGMRRLTLSVEDRSGYSLTFVAHARMCVKLSRAVMRSHRFLSFCTDWRDPRCFAGSMQHC